MLEAKVTEEMDIQDGLAGQNGQAGQDGKAGQASPLGADDQTLPAGEGEDRPFGHGPFGTGPFGDALDLIPLGTLSQAAECLKVMAHPLRLHIVDILMQAEMPVNRIAQLCNLPPHQACEHLRLLKGHALLDSVRRGRTVYYRIADPRLPGLLNCIRACCGLALPTRTPASK